MIGTINLVPFFRINYTVYNERSSSNELWENVPSPEMVSYKY